MFLFCFSSLSQTQLANKSAAPKRKRAFTRTIKTSTKKACSSTLTSPKAQEASDDAPRKQEKSLKAQDKAQEASDDAPHKQEKSLLDMTPHQLRRRIRDLENLKKKNKKTIEDLKKIVKIYRRRIKKPLRILKKL